ncbi:hypothetical protein AB0Q95_12670 [Streptomyces sp. NPDC059900]|uniref:hypothetical protein n=1 Tax=Streptomyces sp. NPDC059900 TaxID=3155816 RepID=UPI00341FC3C4
MRSSRPSTGPASAAGSRSGTGLATTGQPAPTGRGRRFRAAVLGSAGAGGSRGSDGVAPQRWSAMSYGRRLLAALLGLRVRPEPLRVRPQPLTGAPTPHTPEQSAGVRPPARPRPGTGASLSAEAAEPQGAGAFAVFAVLAPVLSGTAAVIFFLVGLVLKMFRAESAVAGTMISAGWLFAAAAVGAIVVCVTILLVTAVRRRDRQTEEDPGYGEIEEVERARDAWREALLERGIVPFLREALDPARAPAGGPSAPSGRLPALGYHRPDFSAPGDRPDPDSSPRPRYTSPDFTSPDFGGPEHRPD